MNYKNKCRDVGINVFELVRTKGVAECEKILRNLEKSHLPDSIRFKIIGSSWVSPAEGGFTVPELRRVLLSLTIINDLGGYERAKRVLSERLGAKHPYQIVMLTQALRDFKFCYLSETIELKRPIQEWFSKHLNSSIKMFHIAPLVLKPVVLIALLVVTVFLMIVEFPFVWNHSRKVNSAPKAELS
ncbi:hypothetical protein [Acinetobacter calcoaceticus]